MGTVSELFAVERMSQTGMDTRIYYGSNGKIEYVASAPIGAPTSIARWKVAKILYDVNKRETRILNDVTQQILDSRNAYFTAKYGV